ncbi:MAG: hypothetical protein KDJ27_19205 [Gammaproteobacteria bacterium]|nr:hypothetical protein [Caldilineaceae bacterium]MCB1925837.1 hypothetical protein [Gammaproteobacteria bacterium]
MFQELLARHKEQVAGFEKQLEQTEERAEMSAASRLEIARLKAELEKASAANVDLDKQLALAHKDADELRVRLGDMRAKSPTAARVAELSAKVESLEAANREYQEQLSDAQSENEALKARLGSGSQGSGGGGESKRTRTPVDLNGRSAQYVDGVTIALSSVASDGAVIVANGVTMSWLWPGSRFQVVETGDRTCHVDVMDVNMPDNRPASAKVVLSCVPKKKPQ